MCFSAPVSFGAAGILGLAGLTTLARIRTRDEVPLAAIPLVFAAQQALEGALWLTVPAGPDHSLLYANLFAAIALILWPLLIPVAMGLVETDPRRRILMFLLVPASIGVAVDYAGIMFRHPYRAWPVGHALTYVNNHPISPVMLAIYVVCACLPPLISSSPALRLFGLIVIAGLAFTFLAFYEGFISVWCFFAALASLTIWQFFRTRRSLETASG